MSAAGDSGMEQLLKAAVEAGAQSLLIKAGDVFRARIDGELVRLSEKPFTAEDTRRIAQQLLPERDIRENIDQLTDRDFAWHLENLARFRVNILRQRGTLMVVMRVIPWDIPSVEQLNLPEVLETLADTDSGLILVTGSTGSGKSTTQAAMVGWINRHRKKHVITLEDPIEYRHDDHQGTVTQREVGRDTRSFRTGLRTALRQDPDVILIGEMRDAETLGIAMEAAETGQLVISTFHAATSLGTLSRVMAMFPADDEQTVRKRLAEALRAVVSQRLILRKQGEGRVPVVEVLRFTGAVQDAVLRGEPPSELRRLMEEGSQYGMQTFDQHLMELVQQDVVAYETAKEAATSPSDFELVMQTLADEADGDGPPGLDGLSRGQL
jgi:twitching motility protein PilT